MKIKSDIFLSNIFPEPVIHINDDGIILNANKAANIIYAQEGLAGRNIKEYLDQLPGNFLSLLKRSELFLTSAILNKDNYKVRFIPIPEDGFLIIFLKDVGIENNPETLAIPTKEEIIGLYAHLQEMTENEREKISGELHDSVGPNLLFVKMLLSNSSTEKEFSQVLEQILPVLDSTIEEVKLISRQLKPAVSGDVDLAAAVLTLITKRNSENTIQGEAVFSGKAERLDITTETLLYYIVQEAVDNILQNSGTGHYTVQVINKPATVVLIISDDGTGINFNNDSLNHFGLLRMQILTKILNGKFNLENSPGKGAVISISVPTQK